MIPLTFIEYELEEKPDKVFSRLNWAVEEVELNWSYGLDQWKLGPETEKDWIGEINERDFKFKLKEPRRLFHPNIEVMLKGNIEFRVRTTNVKIKLGLTFSSFLILLAIYLMTAFAIFELLTNIDSNSYASFILFLIAFPILGTFLVIRRMKRAEKKLDKLFR